MVRGWVGGVLTLPKPSLSVATRFRIPALAKPINPVMNIIETATSCGRVRSHWSERTDPIEPRRPSLTHGVINLVGDSSQLENHHTRTLIPHIHLEKYL